MASGIEHVLKQFSAAYENTLFCRLDNIMTTTDTDPDVFLSEMNQLRDEFCDLDEVVSTERLTALILDTLPTKTYLKCNVKLLETPI